MHPLRIISVEDVILGIIVCPAWHGSLLEATRRDSDFYVKKRFIRFVDLILSNQFEQSVNKLETKRKRTCFAGLREIRKQAIMGISFMMRCRQ